MNRKVIITLMLMLVGIVGCSDVANPVSSNPDREMTSGTNENDSGTNENDSGTNEND